MTRHTLNGRLLQYTIAPEFRIPGQFGACVSDWNQALFSSPAIIREPGYEASMSSVLYLENRMMRMCTRSAIFGMKPNGKWDYTTSYWSRHLNKLERNYLPIALAAVSALKKFYPYLYGLSCDQPQSANIFDISMDGRLSRWILFFQQFDLEVYKPGKAWSS